MSAVGIIMQQYGQSYGARSFHLSWLMRLSEGVRGSQSCGSNRVITKLLKDKRNKVWVCKKLITIKGSWGAHMEVLVR